MYGELYQYLILHKELHLPGVGTLLYEKQPAHIDITEKMVYPPSHFISFEHNNSTPTKNFFSWLGAKLGTSERDAVRRFNDFLYDLRNQISTGNKLQWSGIGVLSKGLSGETKFEAESAIHTSGSPIPAVKVLREHAEHTVRVGEDHRTSVQMRELLHAGEEGKRSWWWLLALILLILSIIFIGYYFSSKGLTTSAAANQQQLTPAAASH